MRKALVWQILVVYNRRHSEVNSVCAGSENWLWGLLQISVVYGADVGRINWPIWEREYIGPEQERLQQQVTDAERRATSRFAGI
ncbi:hypothetical protein AMJ39_06980 [candidate division TA06 bacterium DG_24]|uniref:Uncharacterized protein n=3 Tax=Bacteria division TA06 TaxID=1156500 RepID=A0A0S8JKN5_UNCT6|nr:MAG: hypothetical protein AMJ39_06980 [candidate division TA06 bacterium DG_24]KPK68680.1 MAG: hypothetical protein AMJ82_07565 [candidate division TA06 bacterium SM23_40]KPL09230.1 MAG: hypothetical protein AMJ71_06925 [candidate division TA06 bacterium SM1_40]